MTVAVAQPFGQCDLHRGDGAAARHLPRLAAHRELHTSRRVRLVFDRLVEALAR